MFSVKLDVRILCLRTLCLLLFCVYEWLSFNNTAFWCRDQWKLWILITVYNLIIRCFSVYFYFNDTSCNVIWLELCNSLVVVWIECLNVFTSYSVIVINVYNARQNHWCTNILPTAEYTSAHFKSVISSEFCTLINVLCPILCRLCAGFGAALQTELPTGNTFLCGNGTNLFLLWLM